jgi:hypothetical protein
LSYPSIYKTKFGPGQEYCRRSNRLLFRLSIPAGSAIYINRRTVERHILSPYFSLSRFHIVLYPMHFPLPESSWSIARIASSIVLSGISRRKFRDLSNLFKRLKLNFIPCTTKRTLNISLYLYPMVN